MRRDYAQVGAGDLIAYGHYGQPVLAFPAERGRAWDLENFGMVDAVADLIDAGRVKLYCVTSRDGETWSDRSRPTEERARRHEDYESWLLREVVPWIAADCGGSPRIITTGVSMGAYHAVNVALRHADVFPVALGLSGNYDPSPWHAWAEQGSSTYFHNPMAYVRNLHGEHLDWLRGSLSVVLVVGQGAFEVDPTRALPGTRAMAALLKEKGIPCELDVWGHDVPHDWPSWCALLRHHLARFC